MDRNGLFVRNGNNQCYFGNAEEESKEKRGSLQTTVTLFSYPFTFFLWWSGFVCRPPWPFPITSQFKIFAEANYWPYRATTFVLKRPFERSFSSASQIVMLKSHRW